MLGHKPCTLDAQTPTSYPCTHNLLNHAVLTLLGNGPGHAAAAVVDWLGQPSKKRRQPSPSYNPGYRAAHSAKRRDLQSGIHTVARTPPTCHLPPHCRSLLHLLPSIRPRQPTSLARRTTCAPQQHRAFDSRCPCWAVRFRSARQQPSSQRAAPPPCAESTLQLQQRGRST